MTKLQIEATLAWVARDLSNVEAAKFFGIDQPRNIYAKMGSNIREMHRMGFRIRSYKPLKVRGTVR